LRITFRCQIEENPALSLLLVPQRTAHHQKRRQVSVSVEIFK
jgi:hypothetical protein